MDKLKNFSKKVLKFVWDKIIVKLLKISGLIYWVISGIVLILFFLVLLVSMCSNDKTDFEVRVKETEKSKVKGKLKETEKIMEIIIRLKTKHETPHYITQNLPDSEVVEGQKGLYTIIDLMSAKRKKRLLFDEGEYIMNASRLNEFSKSFSSFVDDIVQHFHGNVKYRIYIRGSADIKGNSLFRGSFKKGFEYRKINYYLKSKDWSGNRYKSQIASETITEPFYNENLPNLRAKFLKQLIENHSLKMNEPIILEGDVNPKTGYEYRNAELILFTDQSTMEKFGNR